MVLLPPGWSSLDIIVMLLPTARPQSWTLQSSVVVMNKSVPLLLSQGRPPPLPSADQVVADDIVRSVSAPPLTVLAGKCCKQILGSWRVISILRPKRLRRGTSFSSSQYLIIPHLSGVINCLKLYLALPLDWTGDSKLLSISLGFN